MRRVLIANRGEIAIRIARAASALGMESVAVYAPADALALHSRFADRAVELAAPERAGNPVAAYLDGNGLIRAAAENGCDGLHPGYGFLSEHAEFAVQCAAAGITFVGPSPDALALFGDKVRARTFARKLGIPVVPGSDGRVSTPEDAERIANSIGYPVMLKAAAGGGGRGIRLIENAGSLAEAFERCSSEALSAFGNGTLFVEKSIARPRHIEVQVLADSYGNVVHLYERDCSVQQRHQKVIEIAPAPALAEEIRAKLLADAVRLMQAAAYSNAGTVEFLVSPESSEYFFIECNPRLQVEHTVTEQVTGIDIVQAQFQVASGATLAALGLGDQQSVGHPRGFAVQARVVATGAGGITAYKEPTGPGVRVDSCGYAGYTPPAEFDPLLAKVIGWSNSGATVKAALDRTLAALDEFHISGLPTNLPALRAILASPALAAGDARTTLLAEQADSAASGGPKSSAAVELFEQQASMTASITRPAAGAGTVGHRPALRVEAGQVPVEAPIDGRIVAVNAGLGDRVGAGDAILVVAAMKMETVVTARTAGVVAGIQGLAPGDSVSAGEVLAVIAPAAGAAAAGEPADDEGADSTWAATLDAVRKLQALAEARLAPGSPDPGVVRQRSRGKLTCRERIDLLLDEGSFHEVGSVAGFASYDDDGNITAFTPANHVGGWGTIEGRAAVVCADDFTSRGGHSDGAIGAKSGYLDRLSLEMLVPAVRLLDGSSGGGSVAAMVPAQRSEGESAARESSGAITAGRPRVTGGGGSYLSGHLGSSMFAQQLATVPVVNMLLGSVVGIGAAKAVLGHFSVMVRDVAQLFVAGPPVVSHAMGYDISKEDLGGWQVHCRNGSVDNLAESEEEAAEMAVRFLSYLPSNVYEAPPISPGNPGDGPGRREERLFTIVPRKRTTTFDIREAIGLMADRDSFFEIGPLWGADQVTGFVRFNGFPLGVIASDSQHVNGGALTADGCSKLTRHLDVCDLFHLPVLNLVDNPGFAVGLEHETTGTIRRGGEWMIAFAQTNVPIFTVLMRRSFGVAGNNYAAPRSGASMRVAWPAADVGGIPPEGGIEAAYKRQLAEAADPVALRAEINARIESARGPLGPLSRFQIEEMIDPRDTRRLVCEWAAMAHRTVSQPARLVPRALQFRP